MLPLWKLQTLILATALAAGCASGPLDDADLAPLGVNNTQKNQLNTIMLDVERQAAGLARNALSPDEVERLLSARDDDIAEILGAQQLAAYDAAQREQFARQIYRSVMARLRSPRPETIRTQGQGPTPGQNSPDP